MNRERWREGPRVRQARKFESHERYQVIGGMEFNQLTTGSIMEMIESLQEFFGGKRREFEKPKVIVIEVPPLMKKSEHADVIAIRHPLDSFRKFTNVPWIMGDNTDEAMGYEWGYSGSGPTDFAFNILLHFTDHDEAVARVYSIDFREEYIRTMPKDGGRIKKKDIFDFIERMKVRKPGLLEIVRTHLDLTTPVA